MSLDSFAAALKGSFTDTEEDIQFLLTNGYIVYKYTSTAATPQAGIINTYVYATAKDFTYKDRPKYLYDAIESKYYILPTLSDAN